MLLREDILKPIAGDSPAGQSLRNTPLWDKIKEARREDDGLSQGAWQEERKVADFGQVIKLAGDGIATQSKDLQLAIWVTEALLRRNGMPGFAEGLDLCRNLMAQFWDTFFPVAEDGDLEDRSAMLEFIASKMGPFVKRQPLAREGYDFYQYKGSRTVLTEEKAKSKEEKTAREKALKEGKIAPEAFDKAFLETPKSFYFNLEKSIDVAAAAVTALDQFCSEKFGSSGPSFSALKEDISQFRQVNHGFLEKKRETEPDPVEPPPPSPQEQVQAGGTDTAPGEGTGGPPASGGQVVFSFRAVQEPADRRQAIESVAAAAALLRRKDPFSPAPYLMLRGLRWGELRGSSDPAILEAPPTEIRQQVKALALAGKWAEMLELSESVMGLPCSRAWLDLQRFVNEACVALGDDYRAIAIAIRSELRALLRDLPSLINAALSDDTAAANAETREWLNEITAEPPGAPSQKEPPKVPVMGNGHTPGWHKKFVDAHALALDAMRAGKPQQAVSILQREVECQLTGRGRFQRKLQLAQICIAAGKDAIAQPLLDDIAAALENHKLEDWEDRDFVAGALVFLLQNSKKIQADAKIKQAFFDRICRLDPVQALGI